MPGHGEPPRSIGGPADPDPGPDLGIVRGRAAVVEHAHRYDLAGTFRRQFDIGYSRRLYDWLLLAGEPDQVRGRVFATEFDMFTLASAISAGAVGWGLDNLSAGLSGVIWWMAILGVIPGVLWSIWTWRTADTPLASASADD